MKNNNKYKKMFQKKVLDIKNKVRKKEDWLQDIGAEIKREITVINWKIVKGVVCARERRRLEKSI